MAGKRIELTDFAANHCPEVIEALSKKVYDTASLAKKGYSIKNGKVFDHIGRLFANSLPEAFSLLGLSITVLRPAKIYVTNDQNDIESSDNAKEIDGVWFYTDTMHTEG